MTPKNVFVQINSLCNIPDERYCINRFGYQPVESGELGNGVERGHEDDDT